MKVKTAELKNNLSRYLRRVRETGETIVICDRDKPVAMLGPFSAGEMVDPKWQAEVDEMQRRFTRAGLEFRRPNSLARGLPKIRAQRAPDGRTDIVTVQQMRQSRDW